MRGRGGLSVVLQPGGQPGGRADRPADGGLDRPARPGALHRQLPAPAGGEWSGRQDGREVQQVGRSVSHDTELQGCRQPPQLPQRGPQAWPAVQAQSHLQIQMNKL